MTPETLSPERKRDWAGRAVRHPQETQHLETAVGPAARRFNRHQVWSDLCKGFLRCHRRPLNVALHLVTTPLCFVGLYAAVGSFSVAALIGLVVVQSVLAAVFCPLLLSLAHAVVLVGLATVAITLSMGPWVGVLCLVVGYFGQDLAHWIVGERTFQSTYRNESNWLIRLIEHTVLLMPVLMAIATRWRQSPLRMLVARKAVLTTKLSEPRHREDAELILDWVRREHPVIDRSHHWWQRDLDGPAQEAFEHFSTSAPLRSMIRRFHGTGYTVEPVLEMNEIYVTGPSKKATSDTVFYMGHVDGPWAVFPGARLYRCMLALNTNYEVTTHFPMSMTSYDQPESHRLENGDAVAFDFNRELHYITREVDSRQSEPRINLKLHFVAYPSRLSFYGRLLKSLTTDYDIRARNLFLNTIAPVGIFAKAKTAWVLGWTRIFETVVRYVGWTNVAAVAVAGIIALVTGSLWVWLALTSFVHYAIYLGTLAERTPVSFGTFRRDAMFFKTLALGQLFLLYALQFDGNSLSLLSVVAGFTLAGYASSVLGMSRTLFSAELGFDTPERIQKFPFGWIPHPMILGAMIGIGAMAGVDAMRAEFGWLIAVHLVAYTFVLMHEVLVARRFGSRPGNGSVPENAARG